MEKTRRERRKVNNITCRQHTKMDTKLFKSKTHISDYHDEMNTAHFMEWFEKQLIPNIPPYSLIIQCQVS